MPKPKILIVASSHTMIRSFLIPQVRMFQSWGYEVHLVGGGVPFVDEDIADRVISLPLTRSPYTFANIKGYRQLRRLIEAERYVLVDCHSPVGGAIGRLAARHARALLGTKVSYTTHGLNFFHGSPKWKWLVFYNIEKHLAKYADNIVTINEEDYRTCLERGFNPSIHKIPGIGVQTSRLCFPSDDYRRELRLRFGLDEDDIIMVYMAEFLKFKNHRLVIDALAAIKDDYPRLKVIFIGTGRLFDAMCRRAAKKGVADRIVFAGYTRAIGPILAGCDIGVSPSYTEGLGLNIAEEMFTGIPIVASDCRGHRELIESGKEGLLFPAGSVEAFVAALRRYLDDPAFAARMAEGARKKVRNFLLDRSLEALSGIYRRLLGMAATKNDEHLTANE